MLRNAQLTNINVQLCRTVLQIQKGREAGRQEGGRKEGWKVGRKEGGKEGRKGMNCSLTSL